MKKGNNEKKIHFIKKNIDDTELQKDLKKLDDTLKDADKSLKTADKTLKDIGDSLKNVKEDTNGIYILKRRKKK